MKNNEMNDGLNELIEKLIKSTGARTIKHKELENLGSAVETIKECVSKDKLIGYIAIGVSNTGEVVNAIVGSKFAIYEMINLLFEAVAKIDTDLGREILEKLKSNFEVIMTVMKTMRMIRRKKSRKNLKRYFPNILTSILKITKKAKKTQINCNVVLVYPLK